MDELEPLVQAILKSFKKTPADQRLLVAIAGPPGCGKSTIAYPLTDQLNTLLLNHPAPHPSALAQPVDLALASPNPQQGGGDEVAVCVGLDGWHFSRAQMDAMDDPVQAHWRRGAAFTFDFASYLTFLQQLKLPLLPSPPMSIPFPTFDHAIKDPRPSPNPITPSHRIVIVEGLYTLLSLPGWKECAEMMDVKVWLDVEREVARKRVIARNFEAGIFESLKKSEERVDAVDMVNTDVILNNRVPADFVLRPIDHPAAAPNA